MAEAYKVLARKYRPKNFKEMVGQTHVSRVLINALETQRLHHAYLFTGTRGVGKTTIARIFAKSLNCIDAGGITAEPCGQCSACKDIDAGRFVDLLEVDAASRTKVDETRELLDNVQYAPARGRYKVYLIDEVHMLSISSFNALLKTLEEPPPHVKFLLATTDPQKLPATVLSRCLQFNLKRMLPEQIAGHLQHIVEQEHIEYEFPAFALLAKAADGSMRDSLSLLDQAIAFGGGKLSKDEVASMLGTLAHNPAPDLLSALADQNGPALLAEIAKIAEFSPDYGTILGEVLSLLQRIAIAQIVPESLDKTHEDHAMLVNLSSRLTPEDVQLFYQIGILGRKDLPLAPEPRGGFEMALLRMLAFRPQATTPSTATPQPTPMPHPMPHPMPTSPTPPTSSNPPPWSTTPSAAPSAPAQSAAAPPAAPPVSPMARIAAAPTASGDWGQLLRQLRVGGMTKALADNCSLKQQDDTSLHLLLAPEHASMKTAQLEKNLQDALTQHFGKPIRLSISVGAAGSQTVQATPAILQRQAEQTRFDAAMTDLQNDPLVQEMQAMFDAQIDPGSVRVDLDQTGKL